MMIAVGDEVKRSKTYLDERRHRKWGERRMAEAVAKRGVVTAVRELNTGTVIVNRWRTTQWRTAAYVEWDGPENGWVVEWADDLEVTKPGHRYSFALENVEIPK